MARTKRTPGDVVQRIANVAEALKRKNPDPPVDTYVGGDPAEEEERDFKAAKVAVQHAEEAEAELKRLREENERLRLKEEQYKNLHNRWVLGDYSDLPDEHPFELLVHTGFDAFGGCNEPFIEPQINGKKYPILKGKPIRVPHFVVKHLSNLKIDDETTYAGPDGQPVTIHEYTRRFAFTAHPVYGEAE